MLYDQADRAPERREIGNAERTTRLWAVGDLDDLCRGSRLGGRELWRGQALSQFFDVRRSQSGYNMTAGEREQSCWFRRKKRSNVQQELWVKLFEEGRVLELARFRQNIRTLGDDKILGDARSMGVVRVLGLGCRLLVFWAPKTKFEIQSCNWLHFEMRCCGIIDTRQRV